MNRFWKIAIEPILHNIDAKFIVEVGSQGGRNTKQLLNYCKEVEGFLHSIDPLPMFDYIQWQNDYKGIFKFHKELSLSVLPLLENTDAVLIDGDHNWYTVFHELKIIENNAQKNGKFPVVFVHDIGWPYGRRDLYYNPENIPLAYRLPYKNLGVKIGVHHLVENGGINAHLYNAIYENNPKNGVLTAVEDFLKETNTQLNFYTLNGFHGLGIIIPDEKNSTELKNIVNDTDLVKLLELKRLELVEHTNNLNNEMNIRNDTIVLKEKELTRYKETVLTLNQELLKYNNKITDKEQQLVDVIKELEVIKNISNLKSTEIHELKDDFKKSLEKTKRIEGKLKQYSEELQKKTKDAREYETAANIHLNSIRYQLGDLIIKSLTPSKNMFLFPVYLFRLIKKARSKKIGLIHPYKVEKVKMHNQALENNQPSKRVKIDIVVCVHNALNDVKICLNSIVCNTKGSYRIIIVNDGSDIETVEYLKEFSSSHSNVKLISNSDPCGYTVAANQGLKASDSEYVILLNSDTIVPQNWTEKLIECAASDPKTGIVGPLSNAASWQSIPEIFEANNDWKVNQLSKGMDLEQMSSIVNMASIRVFPKVSFVNGFCFMITRNLIKEIGYLDEEIFPKGYGEENDYCIRAQSAGFNLRIADHCYIYHHKSKSFTHEKRLILAKNARGLLREKHGDKVVDHYVNEIKNNERLMEIRERVKSALDTNNKKPRILFLLPAKGGGGGAHSIVQETIGMRSLGYDVKIATKYEYKDTFLENYPEAHKFCFFYKKEEELRKLSYGFSFIIASIFHSIKQLNEVIKYNPFVIPGYYIQDYEPYFFEEGTSGRKEAEDSYTLIPGIVAFAKTDWIRDIVKKKHELNVYKVVPSIDRSLYDIDFIKGNEKAHAVQMKITAMIRPRTPRRAPKETLQVLKAIKEHYGKNIEIHLFGCTNEDLDLFISEINFEFKNHGILKRYQVAELLKNSNIFIDMSTYQAFGRTGLEAMAVGCATILPIEGGTSEYAIHEENCLLIDTNLVSEGIQAFKNIIDNKELRERLVLNGLKTASNYSIDNAARSEISLFNQIINRNKFELSDSIPNVGVVFTKKKSGTPTGSAFHRLILPLEWLSRRGELKWTPLDSETLTDFKVNILILQRNVIREIRKAREVLSYCLAENIKLIYEIDDNLIGLDQTSIQLEDQEAMQYLMKNAHLVIVSSRELLNVYQKYNNNIHYIPNYLDDNLWLMEDIKRGDSYLKKDSIIRFGFIGTPTHEKDLLMIETALKQILMEYKGKVEFETIGQSFPLANNLTVPNSDFLHFVENIVENVHWDFAIAPLCDNEFNKSKSFLKYLDYTGLKVPGIYSSGFAYDEVIHHGQNGLLSENTTISWYNNIKRFIEDEQLRQKCRINSINDVRSNFLLKNHLSERSQLFNELLAVSMSSNIEGA